MSEIDKEKDDEIKTPDASRSNSFDEDDNRSSSPPILRSNAEINQMESPSLNRESKTTDVSEQIKATIAAKRATFLSSSSSSGSEPETDYVAVNKKDVDSFEPTSPNVVSSLIG